MSKLPFSIFQYSSCREFLQDAYEFFHSQDESFSYDQVATLCSLKSRTEARNFIKGIKTPTDAFLQNFGTILRLDEDEKKYLICLSRFETAGGSAVAFELFQTLVDLRKKKSPNVDPFREIEIAASVLHMTLLTALELGSGDSSPESLERALKNRYSVAEVTQALADLEAHGFVRRAPSGRLEPSQKHIKKYDYNANFFLKRFHQECLEVAKSSLESEAPSERYLVGASFAIHSKVFPRIIQKMNAFVENLMQLEGVAGTPDTVVQINQQLIKMTQSEPLAERGLGREAAERVPASKNESVIA